MVALVGSNTGMPAPVRSNAYRRTPFGSYDVDAADAREAPDAARVVKEAVATSSATSACAARRDRIRTIGCPPVVLR